MSDKKYSLKIEILIDRPNYSGLWEGQICEANDRGGIYDVKDDNSDIDWAVEHEYARVLP